MKVYISDTDRESQIVKIVEGLGNEIILAGFSDDGKGNEGVSRRSIMEADVAIFPISRSRKIGIMDYLAAYSCGIPTLSVRESQEEGNSISPNIRMMSKLIHFSDPSELKRKLEDFLKEVTRDAEVNSPRPYKERR